MQSKIQGLNISLKAVEEPVQKLLDDKLTMQKKLTQQVLDKCSKVLAKGTDEDVSFIMEHLVGILIGTDRSDNFWVEIYLKKIDGLNLALNRIQFSE